MCVFSLLVSVHHKVVITAFSYLFYIYIFIFKGSISASLLQEPSLQQVF